MSAARPARRAVAPYATPSRLVAGMVAPAAGLRFRRGRCGAGHLYAPAESDAAATLREPKDFLVTVAKRVMVDLFRRRTLERAYLEMLTLIPEGYAPSPEQRQSLLESLQQIDAMLDGLGPKAKQAFLLSQLEGLGYADIAVRLGVSVSSVKKYMAKATEHCLLFSLENDVFS
ncbi:sigma-70 family RNA polymerase sigma factor [Serratia marcescens]|nr:sigma-70 family RNA polymerase sigma factor [Serratia marcescens]